MKAVRVAVIVLGALMGLALLVFAESKPAPAPKPPEIPDSAQAAYFKAALDFEHAQAQLKSAQDALQSSLGQMRQVCGNEFQLSLDAHGYPICIAKPEREGKEPRK